MKYLSKFLVLITIFIFSCSKDEVAPEDEPQEQQEQQEENEEPTEIDKSGNQLTTGASGPDLLTSEKFKSLHIEIGYVESFKPDDEAINLLIEFLEDRTYKPQGITFSMKSLQSSNQTPFDRSDWESIEDEHREKYNTENEIAVWIYFSDGKKDIGDGQTSSVKGTAYKNTSIIMYGESFNEFFEGSSLPKNMVIANTLRHEFGHLFGLVNLELEPTTNHEDPESSNHCTGENCLMKAVKVWQSSQPEIHSLDDACLKDLQSIGGK